MARMRVFMVFVLAMTAGGALAFGTYNYVQNLPAKTVSIPTKPVVVAASDLDIGTELSTGDVRVIQWPANAVPADAIGDQRPRRLGPRPIQHDAPLPDPDRSHPRADHLHEPGPLEER